MLNCDRCGIYFTNLSLEIRNLTIDYINKCFDKVGTEMPSGMKKLVHKTASIQYNYCYRCLLEYFDATIWSSHNDRMEK